MQVQIKNYFWNLKIFITKFQKKRPDLIRHGKFSTKCFLKNEAFLILGFLKDELVTGGYFF